MKKLVLALFMGMSSVAIADSDMAILAGFRNTNYTASTAGVNIIGRNGFQVGGLAMFNVADPMFLRLGFIYSQRYAAFDTTPVADIKLTYLDIPVTLLYKFNDFGGIFAGPVVALNQSKECGTGSCTGVQSSITPISFGVQFKFAPQMGGELIYETASGKISDDIQDMKSIGVNFLYYFE